MLSSVGRSLSNQLRMYSRKPIAIKSLKPKSKKENVRNQIFINFPFIISLIFQSEYFMDTRQVRVTAGNGGDGCVSFLR